MPIALSPLEERVLRVLAEPERRMVSIHTLAASLPDDDPDALLAVTRSLRRLNLAVTAGDMRSWMATGIGEAHLRELDRGTYA